MESISQSQELIRKAQGGDRQAFEILVSSSRDAIDRFVRLRVGSHLRNRVEIEDVYQTTIWRALESIDRFQWQGEGSFRRWLQGIAERVILKLARNQRRSPLLYVETERPSEEVSPSRSLIREERFVRFEEALGRLSEDHRRVIMLARIEGLSVPEIAKRMGRSSNAVVHLLSRALGKLKNAFGDTESFHLPPRSIRERGAHDEY